VVRLALRLVPVPPELDQPPPSATAFVDRFDRPLREQPNDDQFGRRLTQDRLPGPLVDATVAAEDKRFWAHGGVDWHATARAASQWLRHGRVVSGGSTITQQLIKLAHPRPRTPRTKVIEAVLAWRLEQVWDKPRILTEYLNRLDYGNLCRGPAEAAWFYFAKPPEDLTVAEAAFLAGLPQAPSRLNPVRHPDRALRRRQWILDRMRETGTLTATEHARATAQLIRVDVRPRVFAAPHFVDLVLARHGGAAAAGAGQTLRTTLDLALHRQVERILGDQIHRLQAQRAHNGAVVVIENSSGDVLALVGSEDYFAPAAGQVNGAWAPRSAGSTFKPFTYLLAFERGATAATIAADVPTEFPTPTGVFRPVNYDRRWRGPLRYRLTLANSLNIPAVRVLAASGGPEALRDRLRACGLTTLDRPAEHYGLGLTIGNAEARLLELTGAYAALARLGVYRPYRLVLTPGRGGLAALSSFRHSVIPLPPGRAAQALTTDADRRVGSADAAWLVADILADNAARVLAFGVESDLRFDFPVACKTGTSSDFRDNWAFGYTPEFTVGVWVGNFDGSPMERVSGVTGAAPVLHEVFVHLRARFGTTWYPTPEGLHTLAVHPATGHRIGSTRPEAVFEKFLPGTEPAWETDADYDSEGRVLLPSEYEEWVRSDGERLGLRFALTKAPATGTEPPSVRWITPLPGTTYVLDADLPESSRWVRLRVAGADDIEWDSPTLELRGGANGTRVRLAEGRHEIAARVRSTGARSTTWIQVRKR
jgi:penicillin-binding protein 1C